MPSKPASPPPSTQSSEPCVVPSRAYDSTPPANARPTASDEPPGARMRVLEARRPRSERLAFGRWSRHEQLLLVQQDRHDEQVEHELVLHGGASGAAGAAGGLVPFA